ncbi:Solute carrier family 2, facilitated glucose transporter member 3 [Thelohanellus kitauei]|uniref:Solute carrier family 2, facilitated glucose transporter member 3 n=1 Tax=Thelohanellus kitauei TaxID=669202 RepID=A0A0C2IHT0_THEKT|nr:Solute carrier family 2, facilitated glucose transporter member 3 [Thelohanellus kitauei]
MEIEGDSKQTADQITSSETGGRGESVQVNLPVKDKDDLSRQGFNASTLLISSLMLLGPVLMGITIACIGNDNYIKRHFYQLHYDPNADFDKIEADDFPSSIWSIGFLYPFGGWFGSIIGGYSVDRFGRKAPSILFCLLAMLSAILKVVSKYAHIALLFISRFFDGISAAGLMVSALLLMFETLPPRLEKIFKPLIQISVNFGIVLISIITLTDFVGHNWNFAHALAFGVALILCLVVIMSQESPKYIYNQTRDIQKAVQIFKNLRGKNYSQREVELLTESASKSSQIQKMSVGQFLKERRFTVATISLIVLHMGQQLSGINSIMAFAPSILRSLNFQSPDKAGLAIASLGLLGSIIFAPIVGNQRRKLLWIIGFLLMMFSFGGFLANQELTKKLGGYMLSPYVGMFFLGLFVFIFQLGPGPVVWFISVEMFPPSATGPAQGIASFFNWFANTLVFLLFPILLEKLSYSVLIIFMVFQLIVVVYSAIFVVETFKRDPNDVLDDYQRFKCCC